MCHLRTQAIMPSTFSCYSGMFLFLLDTLIHVLPTVSTSGLDILYLLSFVPLAFNLSCKFQIHHDLFRAQILFHILCLILSISVLLVFSFPRASFLLTCYSLWQSQQAFVEPHFILCQISFSRENVQYLLPYSRTDITYYCSTLKLFILHFC